MTEVHKAMLALGCVWYPVTNYRVLCLWKYISPNSNGSEYSVASASLAGLEDQSNTRPRRLSDGVSATTCTDTNSRYVDASVKIALSLYKVQQNIYLLDFQKTEVCLPSPSLYSSSVSLLSRQGDAFGFMKLCALIITELKNLSAASRANMSIHRIPAAPEG
jgi:5'-AMP-activated protein kinase, catalytic alpha subunit